MENSIITGNSAHGNGGGIHKAFDNGIFSVINSEISKNSSDSNGGGIMFDDDEPFSPVFLNVTLADNSALEFGSGIFTNSNGANPIIQNSIIWGNESIEGGHIFLGSGCEIIVNNSNLQGGESAIIGFDDIIYNGNINLDPEFVDSENGDYNLQVISPCIDAGSPNSPADPDGTIADMGAYYYDQVVNIPGCMDESAQNYDPDANINLWCIFGPTIISVYDTPDDQGGYVFLNWLANSMDVLPNTTITHYSAWRYVPNERGWEFLGDTPAGYESDYTFTAPTIDTSIPSDSLYYYTEFKVKAHTSDPAVFFESDISSGYSLDDIVPEIPENVDGIFLSGEYIINWTASVSEDISYYNIYRDGDFLGLSSTTSLVDEEPLYEHEYYISGFDVHGNESNYSYSVYFLRGDINDDYAIDILDIVLGVGIILDTIEFTEEQYSLTDYNADGEVNILDLVRIVDHILNI